MLAGEAVSDDSGGWSRMASGRGPVCSVMPNLTAICWMWGSSDPAASGNSFSPDVLVN